MQKMQKCKKRKKHKVQKYKNKKPLERQLLVQKAKQSKRKRPENTKNIKTQKNAKKQKTIFCKQVLEYLFAKYLMAAFNARRQLCFTQFFGRGNIVTSTKY